MNHLFTLALHNTLAALVLALLVYGLTRVWRSPPVAHLLWLLVLLRLVAPPLMHVGGLALRLPETTEPQSQASAAVPQVVPAVDPPSDLHGDLHSADGQPRFVDRPATRPTAEPAAHAPAADPATAAATAVAQPPAIERAQTRGLWPDLAAWAGLLWTHAWPVLLGLWLFGAALFALVTGIGIVRFDRLLGDMLPASERLQRLAQEIAGKLGIRRMPDVRYVESAEVPFLWCAGRRPTIVLPIGLLRQLDDEQAGLILAHELAHLRRRDHWVRAIEMFVTSLYWWNPLVWMIRRQIHQSEDICCDAWVRSIFPDSARRYAEVLLQAAESLTAPDATARLLPASRFLHTLPLKARIEMIFESRFAPSVSRQSLLVVAIFALLTLPSFVETTRAEPPAPAETSETQATAQLPEAQAPEAPPAARKPDGAPAPAQKSDAPAQPLGAAAPAQSSDTPATSPGKPDAPPAEFSHVVNFEQGATQFADGDAITILEVRGTADTMTKGNTYWIRGTYTLASHDRATLAAYITAREKANGRSPSMPSQSTIVDRGDGTFTLILPMNYDGWPHVSFYPGGGGSSFGGNYFGSGDSVLKQWWGRPATTSAPAPKAEIATTSEFPYVLKFQQGATRFADGDKITIDEVRGTADTMTHGNVYWIKGTYTLASRDQAILLASATVTNRNLILEQAVRGDIFLQGMDRDPGNATGAELRVQRVDIRRGTGTFALFLPMPYGGFPHVSFCGTEGGGASFGGNYFGSGDSLLKQWWNINTPAENAGAAPTSRLELASEQRTAAPPVGKTAAPPVGKTAAPTAEFPHVVKFELGNTHFANGDKITILEVRGTSETMTPGNSYWIRGTYTLASRDRATVAAFVTADDPANAHSTIVESQTAAINRGDGTFTLVLPMTYKGGPHVSFYTLQTPDGKGGQGAGGVYFGTGDSVRK